MLPNAPKFKFESAIRSSNYHHNWVFLQFKEKEEKKNQIDLNFESRKGLKQKAKQLAMRTRKLVDKQTSNNVKIWSKYNVIEYTSQQEG